MNKITSINGTLLASLNELKEHTENGTVHVTEDERTAWNTQATVKAKGILIATQEDLEEHAGNKALHVTEEERATWNAKADASALSGKVSTTTFNSHTDDAVKHVTAEERAAWTAKQDKLTDNSGNMTLAGGLTTAAAINANGGVNIPVAPPTLTHAARLVDVQRSCLASVLHYHPTTAKASATLGNVQDHLNGVIYSGPGSARRRISAVSYRVEMHNTYQSLGAVIKITLMRDLWGSTTICLSGSTDISDNADSPMLSTAAIAQLTINDEDNDDAYKIYDHQGIVLSQGTLPRTLIGHNIIVDLYVVRWHSRFYFYQGCVWTNRENFVPGNSYELPLYLGSAPTNTGYYGAINVICAKGCNNHMWGNVPKGILHRIDEFRLPDAGMFFPNLTD